MSDITGSFSMVIAPEFSFAGFKSTTSSFAMTVNVGFSWSGNRNALDLTVDTPGTLSLSVNTPGTLSL